MAQTQPHRRIDYWRMAWKRRPRSRFFTPYRAIPSVVAAACAFLFKYHKDRSASPLDMWIAIGIIIGVYLVLYAVESLWSFIVISPVNLYAEQADVISQLTEQNSKLYELANPKVSPEEERRRRLVTDKLQLLDQKSRQILRYIMDCGKVHKIAIYIDSGFQDADLNNALAEGKLRNLLIPTGDFIQVNPELKSALDFVLCSEGF